MTYEVTVSAEAEAAINRYIDYIAYERLEPINADKVWTAIWESLTTLEVMPNRCPEARESFEVDYTIRALVVKKTIVLLLRVYEDEKRVMVIGLRTGGQQNGGSK